MMMTRSDVVVPPAGLSKSAPLERFFVERRAHRLEGVKAGDHVDRDHADALRLARRVAVNRHQAAEGLQHHDKPGTRE